MVPTMTKQEVVAIVERERERLAVDPQAEVSSVGKALVARKAEPARRGGGEHRVAWVVELSSGLGYVRVHVDDQTGDVLDVVRSS